jgi:hypothetical protein
MPQISGEAWILATSDIAPDADSTADTGYALNRGAPFPLAGNPRD